MANSPFDFFMESKPDFEVDFVHRSFNTTDLNYFVKALSYVFKTWKIRTSFMQACYPYKFAKKHSSF